jgi:chromosome segregation ATPase
MEEEMDDLRHRMENLELRMKEMRDDNKQLLSQLKQMNKWNDLLLIKLNKDQANNTELNKSHRYEPDSLFLYYQSQSFERINRLKELSKALGKIGPI